MGGAAAAGGIGQEVLVAAWLACHVLARRPLPKNWRLDEAHLLAIGVQTSFVIDDVGATTAANGYVLVQSKRGMGLDTTVTSPLADALKQVVKQFLHGVQDGGDDVRSLERGRDLLVIAVDATASASVRHRLADVVGRFATWPDALSFDDAAPGGRDEEAALEVLLAHLRHAFEEEQGVVPSDAQLRECCRVLLLVTLDVTADGPQRVGAEALLNEVLLQPTPEEVSRAWSCLVELCLRLDGAREWADRPELARVLHAAGFRLRDDPLFREDIARLRAVTADLLNDPAFGWTVPTPEGPVALSRDVTPIITSADGNVALTGPPGAGKSVVARALAKRLVAAGEDVVLLSSEALAGSSATARAELRLSHDLADILVGWDGSSRATLVLDGLDATRGTDASTWLLQLALRTARTRWRIVGTIRSFDLRHGNEWQRMFAGAPVDLSRREPALAHVRHLLIDELTDSELGPLRSASPSLGRLFDAAGVRLASLLHIPFNLRLAGEILISGPSEAITVVRSRLELLELYWERRVSGAADGLARRRVLVAIAGDMVRSRRLMIADPARLLDVSELGTLSQVISDGVLREDVQSRRAAVAPLTFSHPILFDFTAAVLVLADAADPGHIVRALDADPELSLVIRPSLDLHLSALWRDDPTRREFWAVASRLMGAHPLAASAAAVIAMREHPTIEDLVPLIDLATAGDSLEASARMLLAQLGASLVATELTDDEAEVASTAIALTAERLAAVALQRDDLRLADVARYLVFRLESR